MKGILLLGGIALFVLLVLFAIFRKRLQSSRLGKKIKNLIMGFWQGLQTVRSLDRPAWFIFHSINIWVMYFLMTYLCFFAFPPTSHLSATAALLVFVFGGWGIVVPSPGGMGSYHYLVGVALGLYGIGGDNAFSWAMIAFVSINLGCNILVGLIGLVALPIINRDYHPAPALQTQ